MDPSPHCPDCGAAWTAGKTCQDDFYQMLYWENEFPGHGAVHHLAVLGYYLQHPGLYSPDGLEQAKILMVDFVERGASPGKVRAQNAARVSSSNRGRKIKGKPGARGSYAHPVDWTMIAADVTAAGAEHYIESVQAWARSILQSLRAAGEL